MNTLHRVSTIVGLFALAVSVPSPSVAQTVDTVWIENWEGTPGNNWGVSTGVWEWGIPTPPPNPHQGQRCAATVLGGNYPNNSNTQLVRFTQFVVPPASQNPRLRFWHWFSFTGADFGFVEIKVGNGLWQSVSDTLRNTGSGVWSFASIDLSRFADSLIQIAFHFTSDVINVSAGWYIDEVMVLKGPVTLRSVKTWEAPFGDYENGIGDWYVDKGTWEVGVPTVGPSTVPSPPNCAGTVLSGNYAHGVDSRLVSPRFRVPSASQNPQLRFYHWYSFTGSDFGRVQIRVKNGPWQSISPNYSNTSGGAWSWTLPYSLSAYADTSIQIGFSFVSDVINVSSGWYIDSVRLEEIEPDRVTLVSPPNFSQNVTLPVRMVWNRAQRATSYRLQMSQSFDFATPFVRDTSGLTDTSITIEHLQANATYFWRVSAYNSTVASIWSETRRFRTGVTQIAIDGDFSESGYRLLAPKQNMNQCWGNEDITNVYYRIATNNLYLGIEGDVQNETNCCNLKPDGIGVFLNFTRQNGRAPGLSLGIDSTRDFHFINGYRERRGSRTINFKADFEVDYMLAFYSNADSSRAVGDSIIFDAATHLGGRTRRAQRISVSNQLGQSVLGPAVNGVFSQSSIEFAFRRSGGPGSRNGVEIRIPFAEFGGTPADSFQLFSAIVSASGYFSDMTVPGNVVATNCPGLGFDPDFSSNSISDSCACNRTPNSTIGTGPYHTLMTRLDSIIVTTPPGQVPPASFELSQNYPNPFNPTTRIEYAIPKTSHVSLKVFDILGREVATLVNGVQEAGVKSVEFDASGLASGVYLSRLEAGGCVETKKLLLMR